VRLGRPLPRSFYARSSTEVAPDLLGRIFVRRLADGRRLAARIVEVEAYMEGDPASHSFRGRTARNEVMFGRPGHLYVYFTYGMHFCMNVVTGRPGQGSAVLLRAAEPLRGLDEMAVRRGTPEPRRLCAGPGRFAQAFGIDRALNGADVARGTEIALLEGIPVDAARIARSTRVGVTVGVEARWRWFVRGDPFVSTGRPALRVRDSRGS
jgi:DNA-3-methyladenine glycosylase